MKKENTDVREYGRRGNETSSAVLRGWRIRSLAKGRVRSVGFFESILLKIAGRIDGGRGLPRCSEDGEWVSAFIDREINGYEEFGSYLYGTLQMENEANYARLEEIINDISQTCVQIDSARSAQADSERAAGSRPPERKKGEDRLTDAQVAARRSAERENSLAPVRAKTASLEKRLEEEISEFLELHSRLTEDDNTTRMIAQRVMQHSLMRLDVYYNSALKSHPERADMQVVPGTKMTNHAEEIYKKQHEPLMKKAEKMHAELAGEAGKEAA